MLKVTLTNQDDAFRHPQDMKIRYARYVRFDIINDIKIMDAAYKSELKVFILQISCRCLREINIFN